jgi:FOG: HPt domain
MSDPTVGDGAGSADAPALDPAALERLNRFGGGKLLREMIRLFLMAAPERIAAARAGLEGGDANAVEMALHALKSSSAQLGAMRMQKLCERGEMLGRAGTLEPVTAIVRDLEEELVQVEAWLTRERDGGTT